MTRISVGVKPNTAVDKMAMAAVREVVRIPNMIKSGKAKIRPDQKDLKFKLGKNHVRFFYDKLKYLENYYNEWRNECLERGFNISDYSDSFKDLPPELYNDYQPTREDRMLIVERITERLDAMKDKDIRYYGEIIDRQHFKKIMREEL